MRQGCISLGNIKCDGCHRVIPHSGRYLLIEETTGEKTRLCVECCLEKGYAQYDNEVRQILLSGADLLPGVGAESRLAGEPISLKEAERQSYG